MSAEHNRAERLSEERDVRQKAKQAMGDSAHPFALEGWVLGYLASKQLTDAEWAEKREQVARALAKSEQPSQPWERHGLADQNWYRDDALAAMLALGFTRTSEPGGDA